MLTHLTSRFYTELSDILISSLDRSLTDNYDYFRFHGTEQELVDRQKNLDYLFSHMDSFSEVYEILENKESRELFVQLTAFKILGHKKIRLPLSNPKYYELKGKLTKYASVAKEFLDAGIFDWKLYLTDLKFVGFPIRLYTTGGVLMTIFILKQYEYNAGDFRIGAEKGDVVIDAGACWGDTSLYFAQLVGQTGKVFSFEFTNDVEIFQKNMELNPISAASIELIRKGVWKNSRDILYFNDWGPCTHVSACSQNKTSRPIQSMSIDDLVSERSLNRVDFIKMDIEGAEMAALEGAVETLKRFRPRLAITIYRSMEDFVDIPRMLQSLDLDYEFYINHYTVHNEETVLFASAKQ